MKQPGEETIVFEANMDAAMRAHYRRRGAEAIDTGAMPFDRLLSLEEEFQASVEAQGEERISDYEMRFMARGYRLAFDHLLRGGVHPAQILKHAFARGRQIFHPFFASLSMTEAGLMFSETTAGHSFRCKLLSGELKLAGCKGIRLPGQKNPESSAKYAEVAARTKNRAKRRQGSFLKQLKTEPSHKAPAGNRPRQTSFTRKLSAPLQKQRANEAPGQQPATPTTAGHRVSGGSAPTRENGGGVTGAPGASGVVRSYVSDCRSGGAVIQRMAS